jgi:hypothetical protein
MITSQLEILAQGKSYLKTVSKTDYITIMSPNFISSAGSHMRHIIDHYLAIMSGIEQNLINYDTRLRGSQLENSPTLAIEMLTKIANWLQELSTNELNKTITLTTEVSVRSKNVQKVQTSVARELVFAGSHAVHHYAMIAQIANMQKTNLAQSFGLAPATATFFRETNKQAVCR